MDNELVELGSNGLAEFDKRTTRLQKFLDWLNPEITPKPNLTKKQQEYFHLMQTAYHWRCGFFSPDQVRKMLMRDAAQKNPEDAKEVTRSYPSACEIYADMEYVYGKSSVVDEGALKRIALENYHKAIQIALKDKENHLEVSKRVESLTDKIVKLHGLDKTDGDIDPNNAMPARVVQIITNAIVQNGVAKEVDRNG